MARIRKGDTVIVRAGADKGRRGRVMRVLPDRSKAIVEGINLVHKHLKKSQKNPQGGRIRREAAIPLGKLVLVDPATNEGTRVSWKVVDGEKRRVSRKGGGVIASDAKARPVSTRKGSTQKSSTPKVSSPKAAEQPASKKSASPKNEA